MTPGQLRHLVAVAKAGTFRHAAAELKVAQPTLTKAVAALERELGTRIFDRHPRGVTLTEAGQRIVAFARTMIAAEDDLHHDLAMHARLATGRVSVALGPYPSVVSGYAAASRLRRAHPGLAVSLRVVNYHDVMKAVTERRVDVGIAELAEAIGNEDLETEMIAQHPAKIFCSADHPLLRRRELGWPDLLAFPWVTTRLPARIAAAIPHAGGRAGHIDPATGEFCPTIEVDVPTNIASFAIGSDALLLGAYSMFEPEVRAGALALLPIGHLGMFTGYGFMWLRQRSLSPAARAYMDAVRAEERAFVEREERLGASFVRKTRP